MNTENLKNQISISRQSFDDISTSFKTLNNNIKNILSPLSEMNQSISNVAQSFGIENINLFGDEIEKITGFLDKINNIDLISPIFDKIEAGIDNVDKFSNALKNLTDITHLQTLAKNAQALSTKVMNINLVRSDFSNLIIDLKSNISINFNGLSNTLNANFLNLGVAIDDRFCVVNTLYHGSFPM